MNEYCRPDEADEMQRELAYLRKLLEDVNVRHLSLDARSIAIRNELEQKRRGFSLIAELSTAMNLEMGESDIFVSISQRLNSTLNMQRTAILLPESSGNFRPAALHGYPPEEREEIAPRQIAVDRELLDPLRPVLVTGLDSPIRFGAIRETLRLPFFIASPVILHGEIAALQITGRLYELPPFMPRLGWNDVETVQTVGSYIASVLAAQRLRKAEDLARNDPLTQLPNLRGVTAQLRHLLALVRRGGFRIAVMFIDLDGFKAINDTYGHIAGDMVLCEVARRIPGCIRKSDFVGRIGGDEFLVALSHIQQPKDAVLVAQKLIGELREPIRVGDTTCRVGASIGIAIFPDHGVDESSLIHAADAAMYTIKRGGKNMYAFARPYGEAAP